MVSLLFPKKSFIGLRFPFTSVTHCKSVLWKGEIWAGTVRLFLDWESAGAPVPFVERPSLFR